MTRLSLPVNASDHRLGNLTSPRLLVFYADYQCPVCKLTYQILKQLKKEYGERLCLIFRHFPLQKSHPLAKSAALAAEAAGKQNQFWEMHDLLFQNQLTLSPELYLQLAQKLHLDVGKFQNDSASDSLSKKIQDDFDGGIRSGVNGTPCFFIRGDRYDGDATFEGLKKALG
jgi:protein-disulfide isomerase